MRRELLARGGEEGKGRNLRRAVRTGQLWGMQQAGNLAEASLSEAEVSWGGRKNSWYSQSLSPVPNTQTNFNSSSVTPGRARSKQTSTNSSLKLIYLTNIAII